MLAATLATGSFVGVAVAMAGPRAKDVAATPAISHLTLDPTDAADRAQSFSRSSKRVALTSKRVAPRAKPEVLKAKDHRYMTAPLNLWTGPGEKYTLLTVLPTGTKIAVTGLVRGGWAQVIRNGEGRWVNKDYLSDIKPVAATTVSSSGALSSAPCASGSSMESGIVGGAVALHRAVCAVFPQVKEYGGYRPDGEHADGHAIDIMVYSDSGLGQQIADWARANASVLHIDNVIWAQHIWTTQRSSEGWRSMPDRGSTTANHYDHVHVRVF